MNEREHEVVLVTGSSRGIGFETAKLFAGDGASVILCGRDGEEAERAASMIGGLGFPCDVSREDDVTRLFDEVRGRYGRLDVLVNNAGVFRVSPVLETATSMFDDVVGINLRGAFLVAREAFRLMSETGGGLIINVSSTAGKQGFEGSAAYCASKFGVVGFSRVLAMEGLEYGIRVSVIYPGAVDTRIWDGISSDREGFLQPGDVARTIHCAATAGPHVDIGEIEVRPSGR